MIHASEQQLRFLNSESNGVLLTEVISELKKNCKGSDCEDREILSAILSDLETGVTSLLTPQEKRYLSLSDKSRWSEYLAYRWKFKYNSVNNVLPPFPLYLLIEPTSVCNLQCRMCWHTDKTFTTVRSFMGQMDFDLFKRIIDQAQAGGTKAITMASRGEPTLHPRFGEMLAYCSGKFLEIKINTNATKLNAELCRQILRSGVDLVVFSVDAYTREKYADIRGRNVFDKVVENITCFKKIRDTEFQNCRTMSRAHGVLVEDEFDTNKFQEFWGQYCDHVTVGVCDARWDLYNNPLNSSNTARCLLLLDRMYVWFDGTCNPCDTDYKSSLAVGSVSRNTLSEIWNSSKYRELREKHSNGQRSTVEPCNRCSL